MILLYIFIFAVSILAIITFIHRLGSTHSLVTVINETGNIIIQNTQEIAFNSSSNAKHDSYRQAIGKYLFLLRMVNKLPKPLTVDE